MKLKLLCLLFLTACAHAVQSQSIAPFSTTIPVGGNQIGVQINNNDSVNQNDSLLIKTGGTTKLRVPYSGGVCFADSTCQTTASSGASLPLPVGDTNYIQNTQTLQSGATFYVSSGTVQNLTATNLAVTNLNGPGNATIISNSAFSISNNVAINTAQTGKVLEVGGSAGISLSETVGNFTSGNGATISGVASSNSTTTRGAQISAITSTNGTNVGGEFAASGGATNKAINVTAGESDLLQTKIVAPNSATYELTSSSGSVGFHVAISTNGHVVSSGASPAISSCGSTPNGSVVGDDNVGTITLGGGSVTACTLSFANTWGATPSCVITDNSVTIPGDISAISSTAFTVSFNLSLGGGQVYYRCGCSGVGCL